MPYAPRNCDRFLIESSDESIGKKSVSVDNNGDGNNEDDEKENDLNPARWLKDKLWPAEPCVLDVDFSGSMFSNWSDDMISPV